MRLLSIQNQSTDVYSIWQCADILYGAITPTAATPTDPLALMIEPAFAVVIIPAAAASVYR